MKDDAMSTPAKPLFTPGPADTRADILQPDGQTYVPYRYDDKGLIVLHVRIALATGRPILLAGPPGSGKSTLARDVALCLGWRYYERVITSRTQARDLQWRWDAVARLADVQGPRRWVETPQRFVDPEALWWAFAPGSASRRGLAAAPQGWPAPVSPHWRFTRKGEELPWRRGSVILLDEIDKADPDVPNDLLVALGERRFVVEETRDVVTPEADLPALVFLTTNGERDLPQPFLRRCISITLDLPVGDAMKAIVERHVPESSAGLRETLVERHAAMVVQSEQDKTRPPGTAEFIDAARAAAALFPEGPHGDPFEELLAATLWKRPRPVPVAKKTPA
jgi:MoxR-like ATPase